MQDIGRKSLPIQAIDVTNTIGTCTAIDLRHAAGGAFIVASGASLTSLAFYGCATSGGTYKAIYDKTNTAVTRTVAVDRAYSLPDECYAFRFVKALGNNTGTLSVMPKG